MAASRNERWRCSRGTTRDCSSSQARVLSVPVELGLGVRRPRPRPRRPRRGRAEVRSLLRGQWADGMVPHIVFHTPEPRLLARPGALGLARRAQARPRCRRAASPSPRCSRPPCARCTRPTPDRAFLEEVLPALEALARLAPPRAARLDGSGLVAIVHPWESADNSPRFDHALERIAAESLRSPSAAIARHADAAERPTDLDYRRYSALVDRLRDARLPARVARRGAVRLRRPPVQRDSGRRRGRSRGALGGARRRRRPRPRSADALRQALASLLGRDRRAT